MRIVKPEVVIMEQNWYEMLNKIELIGRVCYKSEDRITANSADKFIRSLVKSGHHSVLEHASLSMKFTVDRGVSHEIVRHRIASPSQESTRYCNYGGDVSFIEPYFFKDGSPEYEGWKSACEHSEQSYDGLIARGCKPQEARTVLNNSLKTELWLTANLREWRHFFTLRAAKPAHPQMRQVVIPALHVVQELLPPVFEDIEYDTSFPVDEYAKVRILIPSELVI